MTLAKLKTSHIMLWQRHANPARSRGLKKSFLAFPEMKPEVSFKGYNVNAQAIGKRTSNSQLPP